MTTYSFLLQLEFVTSTTGDFRAYSDWTLAVSFVTPMALLGLNCIFTTRGRMWRSKPKPQPIKLLQPRKNVYQNLEEVCLVRSTPVEYNCSTIAQFTSWPVGKLCGIAEKRRGCKNARILIAWISSGCLFRPSNTIKWCEKGDRDPATTSALCHRSLRSRAFLCDLTCNIPLGLRQSYFLVSSLSWTSMSTYSGQ